MQSCENVSTTTGNFVGLTLTEGKGVCVRGGGMNPQRGKPMEIFLEEKKFFVSLTLWKNFYSKFFERQRPPSTVPVDPLFVQKSATTLTFSGANKKKTNPQETRK